MSIDREPLSNIVGLPGLAIRRAERGRTEREDEAYRRNHLIIYFPANGKNSYVATVSANDLFDMDGNRFYDDGEG